MSDHQVTLSIYGSEFTLRTEDDPEELKTLGAAVDREMRRVAEDSGLMQPQKVATLTALHLAGELAKLRLEHDDLEHRIDALASRLEPLLDPAVGADA